VDEAGLTWRKSTHSETGTCVEVAFGADDVHVRDSKNPDGVALTFTRAEWGAFVAGIRGGEFDGD
jgi:hypothetical protein